MSLRLFTAAIVATFFLMAGLALGQPLDVIRGIAVPPQGHQDTDQDRIRERERTGTDPNVATGTPGTTNRGSASGAADSAPSRGCWRAGGLRHHGRTDRAGQRRATARYGRDPIGL